MNTNMKNSVGLLLCILLSVSTCFGQDNVNKQDSLIVSQDSVRAAINDPKKLAPIDGLAIVYVVRPTIIGAAIRQEITCNNYLIGSTKGMQYIYTVMPPGKYIFRSTSANISRLDLNLQPGKIYFIAQRVSMGLLYARTDLELLSEKEGRNILNKCSLAKDNIYPN